MSPVPIRYSVAEDCARPEAERIGSRLIMKCDGVPILRVISYDIERGEITRTVVDRQGNPLRDPRAPDKWLLQTLRGKIEVRLADG